jgi:hypothetical protein
VQERRYVITVRGRLSERFAATFEGLTLEAGDRRTPVERPCFVHVRPGWGDGWMEA